MSTVSTVPTVKAQLVEAFRNVTGGIPVDYAWPGPATEGEHVFLGPHPETADLRLDVSQELPTIKAGRKQRQENYTVRVTVWTFRPDLSADGAQECEERAFTIAGLLEDVLADDVRAGLPTSTVHWIKVDTVASTLFPFQKGWACELSLDLDVQARLT